MKPRGERQKVMIRARMRSGASWHDVCILNVSAHGLGIQAAQPPGRGVYVEICRGRQAIVARVVWARGHRAGLRSQDAISVRALVAEPKAAGATLRPRADRSIERRSAPRSAHQRQDHSRMVGRAVEFGSFLVIVFALAAMAVGTLNAALAEPLSAIRKEL